MENKMGESATSCGALQVSVSFGRFENDSLSWEKWSSFSPNKYLEEVGKCSTPGSVAEKKAYFEAHYKKIAARKAELLLEQDKQMETSSSRSNSPSCEDNSRSNGTSLKFGISNGYSYCNGQGSPHQDGEENNLIGFAKGIRVENATQPGECNDQVSPQVVKQETSLITDDNDTDVKAITDMAVCNGRESPKRVELDANSVNFINGTQSHVSNEDAQTSLEGQSSVVEGADKDTVTGSPEVCKTEEAVVVQEDTHPKGPHKKVKLLDKIVKKRGVVLGKEEKSDKSSGSVKSHKINPAKMEENMTGLKKKLAPSSPKTPTISTTPKPSKPTSVSSANHASRTPTNKSNDSLLRRRNPTAGENRKAAPTSLHMSLSLGPAISDLPSHTVMRKSFIMEKMGDKDIVKRAFKTFQNNVNQLRSSSDEIFLGKKPVPTKVMEEKVPNSLNLQKKNERTRKSAEKAYVESDQSEMKRNIMSQGLGKSFKQPGVNQKTIKAAPTSFGLRSEKAGKEFPKKVEEKSSADDGERARLISRTKEEKDAEIKRPRQRLGNKATMPGLYQGQRILKSISAKEGTKKENRS